LLIQKAGTKPNPQSSSLGGYDGGLKKPTPVKSGGSALEQFAAEILAKLQEDGLPPIPSCYELYFETMLQDKPFDFRKEVLEQLNSQDTSGDEKRAVFEAKLKEGFNSIKEILQNVSVLYKQILSVIDTTKKRSQEAKGINNPAAVLNFATTLSSDAEMLANFLSKQASLFKELYQKSANIVKEVETESIFDARYGIYNKRYLSNQIDREQKMIGKYIHSSTLLLASLSTSVAKNIGSEKGVSLVNKTMAKLFMKTSRRSDVVAYFGQGIFALLLKHTDIKNAIRTAERLYDMMASTNFFLGDKEIELKICCGIAGLSKDRSADETIESALTALRACDEKADGPYVIGE
jgi:diguanylate cyclase (GGDEF)-like protein